MLTIEMGVCALISKSSYYGSSEISLRYSSSVNTLKVSVRIAPAAPIVIANLVLVFGLFEPASSDYLDATNVFSDWIDRAQLSKLSPAFY